MLILLAIPGCTYKRIPNKSIITMQNNGRSGGTFVRRCHKFYRSGAGRIRQFKVLPTIFIDCPTFQDCKLILQNKEDCKSPDVQRVQLKTLHYLLQVHLLNNAITSFSSCAHQKLTCFPDYLNDKHARQNFKRKAERYKWDEIRRKLFYPKDDQFKNSK